jgi:hypothetical protein
MFIHICYSMTHTTASTFPFSQRHDTHKEFLHSHFCLPLLSEACYTQRISTFTLLLTSLWFSTVYLVLSGEELLLRFLAHGTKHFVIPTHKTNIMLVQMTQIVITYMVAACLDFSLNISTDSLCDNTVH